MSDRSDDWPETRASWARLKRSVRVWWTMVLLGCAANSLGKLGLVQLQIVVLQASILTK